MNANELTKIVALQAEELRTLREELEALRVGIRAWASVAQAHIEALEAKPAAKKQSDWVSGPRPSHPVRRPQAPAAAAAELPAPEELTSSEKELTSSEKELMASVPEDCPF